MGNKTHLWLGSLLFCVHSGEMNLEKEENETEENEAFMKYNINSYNYPLSFSVSVCA